MKKLILSFSFLICGLTLFAQNVGIGTTSPTNSLHIVPSSGDPIRIEGLNIYSSENSFLVVDTNTGVVKYLPYDSLASVVGNAIDTDVDSMIYANDTLYLYEDNQILKTYLPISIDTNLLDSLIVSRSDTLYTIISDSLLKDSLWIIQLDSLLGNDTIYFNDTSYTLIRDSLLKDSLFFDSLISIIGDSIDTDVDSMIYANDTLYLYEDTQILKTYLPISIDTNLLDSLIVSRSDTLYSIISDSLLKDSLWIIQLDSLLGNDTIYFNDTSYTLIRDSLLKDSSFMDSLISILGDSIDTDVDTAILQDTMLVIIEDGDSSKVNLQPLIDSAINQSTKDYVNGLTLTNDSVKLGGVLIENTTIDMSNETLTLIDDSIKFYNDPNFIFLNTNTVSQINGNGFLGLKAQNDTAQIYAGIFNGFSNEPGWGVTALNAHGNQLTTSGVNGSGISLSSIKDMGPTINRRGMFNLTDSIVAIQAGDINNNYTKLEINDYQLSYTKRVSFGSAALNEKFKVDTAGFLTVNSNYILPNVDGTANQVLQTDGSGTVSWGTISGGGSDNDWDINGNGTGLEGNPGTNVASGSNSITAGDQSVAAGSHSVSFGYRDTATGLYSVVSGGDQNVASGVRSVVSGGTRNTSSNNFSVVAGGSGNTASGINSVISGGSNNIASASSAMVLGGVGNTVSGPSSSITGGSSNTVTGNNSVIGGGLLNQASGAYAVVAGGTNNAALGTNSVVSGGTYDTAYSFGEWVGGIHSTSYVPNNTNAYDANDRLFVVGNGTSNLSPSNGLVLYKNGSLEINEAYTLPNVDGTANQVLQTDGSGTVSWGTPAGGGTDSDWYTVGTTSSPSSINDSIFTMGQVGIGNNSPTGLVQVGDRLVLNERFGSQSYISFNNNGTTGRILETGYSSTISSDKNNGGLSFSVSSTLNNPAAPFHLEAEVLRIDTNLDVWIAPGNLGVGLGTSPTNKLHVRGAIDPLRLENLQYGGSTDSVLVTDANGVVKLASAASLSSPDNDWDINGNGTGLEGNPGTNVASGLNSLAAGDGNVSSGDYSVAMGDRDTASGIGSFAFGTQNNARAFNSMVLGRSNDVASASANSIIAGGLNNSTIGNLSGVFGGVSNTANGPGSAVIVSRNSDALGGRSTILGGYINRAEGFSSNIIGGNLDTAFSAYETVLGVYSRGYSPSSSTNIISTDRILTVGNGTSNTARSNGLVLYKNGSLEINEEYTLPNVDGTANQVLTTDGSGTVSWATASGGGTDDQNLTVGAGGANSSIIDIESGNDVTLSGGAGISVTELGNTIGISISSSTLTSGTYAPIETTANLVGATGAPSITVSNLHYIRIGNIVHVTGNALCKLVANGTGSLSLSLPISSNFTTSGDVRGASGALPSENISSVVIADATNDLIQINFTGNAAAFASNYGFSVTYEVK